MPGSSTRYRGFDRLGEAVEQPLLGVVAVGREQAQQRELELRSRDRGLLQQLDRGRVEPGQPVDDELHHPLGRTHGVVRPPQPREIVRLELARE